MGKYDEIIQEKFQNVIYQVRKLTNSVDRNCEKESIRVISFLSKVIKRAKQEYENNTYEQENYVESTLNNLKGEILRDMEYDECKVYLNWITKLMRDTQMHNKDLVLLSELRKAKEKDDTKLIKAIKKKRSKYNSKDYPTNINIGDIYYIQCGYGYCGEVNTNHYGIVMSEIQNQMYFIVPLSSDAYRKYEYSFTGLNLPNKEGNPDKKSFVRFEQSKFIHYRRIEKIKVNETVLTRKLSEEQLIDLNNNFFKFMNLKLTK